MPDPLTAIFLASAAFAFGCMALFATRSVAPARLDGDHPSRPTGRSIFLAALATRVATAVIIRFLDASDFFAPDRLGYEAGGRALADGWLSGSSISVDAAVRGYSGGVNFYHYLNGISYVIGTGPWLILLANCAIGSLVPGLLASITRRLGGSEWAQRRSSLLGAFFPSLVLWSSVNIRDVWALVAILFTLDSGLAAREQISVLRFAILALSILLLGVLRSYVFVLVAIGIALSVIASISISRARAFVSTAASAGLCAYLYFATGFGQQWVQDASLEKLSAIRHGMLQGAQSAFLADADISTPSGAIQFLPIGLAYFWLSPFPWQVRGIRQALTLPEMALIYFLVFHAFRGLREAVRQRFSQAAMILCVASTVSAAYGLVEGNYGTAYRHRAQLLGPFLCLGAIGLDARRRRQLSTGSQAPTLNPSPVSGGSVS